MFFPISTCWNLKENLILFCTTLEISELVVLTNRVTNHGNWLLCQHHDLHKSPSSNLHVTLCPPRPPQWLSPGERVSDGWHPALNCSQTKTPLHGAMCAWKMGHILPVSTKAVAAQRPLLPLLRRCWLFCRLEREGHFVAGSQVLKRHWSLHGKSGRGNPLGAAGTSLALSVDNNQNSPTENGISNSVHVYLESNFISHISLFIKDICDGVCI